MYILKNSALHHTCGAFNGSIWVIYRDRDDWASSSLWLVAGEDIYDD